jgi:hypothetical protein
VLGAQERSAAPRARGAARGILEFIKLARREAAFYADLAERQVQIRRGHQVVAREGDLILVVPGQAASAGWSSNVRNQQ